MNADTRKALIVFSEEVSRAIKGAIPSHRDIYTEDVVAAQEVLAKCLEGEENRLQVYQAPMAPDCMDDGVALAAAPTAEEAFKLLRADGAEGDVCIIEGAFATGEPRILLELPISNPQIHLPPSRPDRPKLPGRVG